MKSAELFTHFRLMAPRLSLSPEAKVHEDIELRTLGAPAPVQQAPRSSRVDNRIARIPALLKRECKQLHAAFAASAREVGKWFDAFRCKAERSLAASKRRKASMETLKAPCSQAAVRRKAALAPARAMRANAAPTTGKSRPAHAQAGMIRAHGNTQPSDHQLPTLREIMRHAQWNLRPAKAFATRINQLHNTGTLVAQLHELNLAQLTLLWSHLGGNGRAALVPGAIDMLVRTRNALLCIGFKEDARAFRL